MVLKSTVAKELLKRGHSEKDGKRVWDISDSKLWYLSPELAEGYLKLSEFEPFRHNIIERETEIIKKEAQKIVEKLSQNKFNLIDVGCGDGLKATDFVKNSSETSEIKYVPVDISEHFVNLAVKNVKASESANVKEYEESISDFKNLDEIAGRLRSGSYPESIVLFLGSTISTFDINDTLFNLSESMFPGDLLVIGNGIRKGPRYEGLEKYKHDTFKNWFMLIMNSIGITEDEVEYDARFTHERVEAFFKLKKEKTVEHEDYKIKLKEGDEIIVAAQHKYFEEELKEFCEIYFRDVEVLKNSDEQYALVVCKK